MQASLGLQHISVVDAVQYCFIITGLILTGLFLFIVLLIESIIYVLYLLTAETPP